MADSLGASGPQKESVFVGIRRCPSDLPEDPEIDLTYLVDKG